jgi:hypothetical protein
MKFLCVPCDTPMKLQTVGPPDRGSLSVVYACPECGYEMAMLTNAYETQIVQSLGVRIGPSTRPAGSLGAGPSETSALAGPAELGAGSSETSALAGSAEAGRCPFSAMIPLAAPKPLGEGGTAEAVPDTKPAPVRWTAAAEARLAKVPEFVRPMARTGIESFARERGAAEVDEKILDAAREFFGM